MAQTIADDQVAYHGALTAATVETVTIDRNVSGARIINRSGSAEVYYTTDGSAPTVKGANTRCLPAAISAEDRVNPSSNAATFVIKLISAATPEISVEAL